MGKYSKDTLKKYGDFVTFARILIGQHAKNYKGIVFKLYLEDVIDCIADTLNSHDETKSSFDTYMTNSIKWKIMTIINKHKRVQGKLKNKNQVEIHPNISVGLNKDIASIDLNDTVDYIKNHLSKKEFDMFYAKYAENTSIEKIAIRFGYSRKWTKKILNAIMEKVRLLKIYQ